MLTPKPLAIYESVLKQLDHHAQQTSPNECMGLLALPIEASTQVVTAACLLPAIASGSHAEADPLDIKEALLALAARQLKPPGLWHSHGNHGVFHSGTDDQTVARILPALAEANFLRPSDGSAVPNATGPDTAVLPLPDGRSLRYSLVGPAIDGLGYERVKWTSATVQFGPVRPRPRAVQEGNFLVLESGEVRLVLGIPAQSTVHSRLVPASGFQVAHLYSLVINNRGERYAEVLSVWDYEGNSVIHKQQCGVEVIPTSNTSKTTKRQAILIG